MNEQSATKLGEHEAFDRTARGFGIRAAGRSADLFLYDEIGYDPLFGVGISAERFKNELLALGDVHEINLYINSPGGGVFEGWAIVELLNRHRATINARIDSRAFSMASVIAMTGDTVSMAANAWMMIHWPYDANAEDGDEADPKLVRIGSQIADVYAKRTGISRRQIETMMKNDTWMDAKDAMKMGFADSIYEPMKVAACACDLSKFRNVPPELASVALAQSPPDVAPSRTDDLPTDQEIAHRIIDSENNIRKLHAKLSKAR